MHRMYMYLYPAYYTRYMYTCMHVGNNYPYNMLFLLGIIEVLDVL